MTHGNYSEGVGRQAARPLSLPDAPSDSAPATQPIHQPEPHASAPQTVMAPWCPLAIPGWLVSSRAITVGMAPCRPRNHPVTRVGLLSVESLRLGKNFDRPLPAEALPNLRTLEAPNLRQARGERTLPNSKAACIGPYMNPWPFWT